MIPRPFLLLHETLDSIYFFAECTDYTGNETILQTKGQYYYVK